MSSKDFLGATMGASFITTIVVLIIFIVLQGLRIPTGHFIDWLVGIASFWWLMIIVTVPWNIHFEARAVLNDAAQSTEAGIPIKPEKVAQVTKIAKRSLWLAVGLHLVSAVGLYTLALLNISTVGYIGSGGALLLTILRPSIRGYEYLTELLSQIRQEFKYPREDVIALRLRVDQLKTKIESLENQLNPQEADSWAAQLQITHKNLIKLSDSLKEFHMANQTQHSQLSHEFQNALSQVVTDGELLKHVRTALRFFKEA